MVCYEVISIKDSLSISSFYAIQKCHKLWIIFLNFDGVYLSWDDELWQQFAIDFWSLSNEFDFGFELLM